MGADTGGGLWTLLTIAGPIVLFAAILWAIMNNRRSRSAEARTEEATRANYDQQDRDDKLNKVH